jgi:hypothetical protein
MAWWPSLLIWLGALVMAIVGGIAYFNHPVGTLSGGGALAVFVVGLILLILGFAIPGLFY